MQGLEIKSIKRVRGDFKVYDFEVQDAHHYFFGNGVLSHNSMFPTNEVAGGGGFKYAASSIATLGKAKDKEGTEVVGNLIRVKMLKSRMSKENSEVRLKLSYKNGLDKYYGLLDLAEKYGIFKKVSTRYELPDGRKVFGKAINDNPTDYYTPEIMAQLEIAARQEYQYGAEGEDEATADEDLDFLDAVEGEGFEKTDVQDNQPEL